MYLKLTSLKLKSPKFTLSALLASSLLSINCLTLAGDLKQDIQLLQKQWAVTSYQTSEQDVEKAFESLTQQANQVVKNYPNKAEPLIWKAIIISSDAGKNGGFNALSKVKQARELLLKAESIHPTALNGSIYTSLGSLYYQVPGWPIGYGDNDMAQQYLQKALRINPNGIDPNYFYGDFLFEEGQYQQALNYFNKALKAPPRNNRPLADKGRRGEIEVRIKQAKAEIEG